MTRRPKAGPKRTKRRKRRGPNSGSFAKGYDPRRHVFTRAECQLGYARCMLGRGRCNDPKVAAWVWRKVRRYYRDLHEPCPDDPGHDGPPP